MNKVTKNNLLRPGKNAEDIWFGKTKEKSAKLLVKTFA
jgi:hypothetical protein